MLVYITKNNFSKIVRKIPVNGLKLDGDLYVRYNKNLNAIFSKFERTELLLYKMLCENPEKFLEEVYTKVEKREDSYTWVYEEQKSPCYHGTPNCPKLNSDFENYQVPLPIKYKGIERDIPLDHLRLSDLTKHEQNIVIDNVKIYRSWWAAEGEFLYKSDMDTFLMRVNMRFQPNPRITDIKEFKQGNSGVAEFDNCTLQDIEERIDNLIIDARDFFYENEKHTPILRAYVKLTYHILVKNEIRISEVCNYSIEDIRFVLEEFNNRFKEPLKNLLRNYFRIKNNPELKMERNILEGLGFVPCGYCPSYDPFYGIKLDAFVKECDIKDEYNKYLNLFLEENALSFARTYISMYYPFTYQEILDRWDYIIQGDAHYSALNFNFNEIVVSPIWGLSFNRNIRWNSKLRAKYEYGYIDEFKECIVGTHRGDVELNERDYLDDILPLDIVREAEIRNGLMQVKYLHEGDWERGSVNTFNLALYEKNFPYMTFEKVKMILLQKPWVILFNKSIWENTLSKVIDLEFCDKVLGCHKPQRYYADEVLPY